MLDSISFNRVRDWNDMRAVAAVYETRSFRLAANQSCLALGTVRAAVARVEHQIGHQLFSRDVHGAHPTDVAHVAYERAQRMREALQ